MRDNLRTLLVVSALFGLSAAIYETALPLYLDRAGISLVGMGWIYFLPALLAVCVPIVVGIGSDRAGRKGFYALALVAQGIGTLLTPLFATATAQLVVKAVREPWFRVRETLHSLLVQRDAPGDFLRVFGRTRGLEYFAQFLGLVAAAGGLRLLALGRAAGAVEMTLLAAGAIMLVNAALFATAYREAAPTAAQGMGRPAMDLRDLLHPHLNRHLWLQMVSMFIFNIGLSCSHAFAPQVFFLERFKVSDAGLFLIMALHRLSIALPMAFAGRLVTQRLKAAYIGLVVIEGILIGVPGYLMSFGWATGLWLLHDLVGAGVWWPIQHALLVRHCDEERRGRQLSVVLSLSALGMALGPLLAGYISAAVPVGTELRVGLPFIAGGALMVLSAVLLVFL